MTEAAAFAPPTIADVETAATRLAGYAVRTPLLSMPALDELVGAHVLLKCENLQRTGSFKFRGACNAIAAMSGVERDAGVVAVSSGNHAQGVAEAARLFAVRATVVMPTDAPAVKRQRTEAGGARIVTYDRGSQDRDALAAGVIAEHGGTLVHPYDDAAVIAGQGTVGLEIVKDCAAMGVRPDAVVIPCGGGGLSAGVGLAARDAWPGTAIVLVEPAGFDDYARSLAAGRIVANKTQAGSVCDALMAPAPGRVGFAVNRSNHAETVAVDDADALAAVAYAFAELRLVVEPGGAVALAALIAGALDVRGRTAVVVLSGGNIDAAILERALATTRP